MSASVLISIVALILTCATAISVTVLVSRALTSAFRALDSMHKRAGDQQSQLLDRFQAIRWEDLAALRSTSDAEDGGFFPPLTVVDVEPGLVEQHTKGLWGRMGNHQTELTDDEAELLAEDFPE